MYYITTTAKQLISYVEKVWNPKAETILVGGVNFSKIQSTDRR